MALKPCPHCGNQISDKATQCPKCGCNLNEESFSKIPEPVAVPEDEMIPPPEKPKYPQRKRSKKWLYIGLPILVVGIIVGAVFYSNAEKKKYERKRARELRIAQLEREDELYEMQKEAERLEQLRQDSIAAANEEIENRLSILTFCKFDSQDNVMDQLSANKIFDNLEKLGFILTDKKTHYVDADCAPMSREMVSTYKRDKYGYVITVKVGGVDADNLRNPASGMIEIIFPNSDLKNYFLKTATQNKFKKDSSGYYFGPNRDCYWNGTDIVVEGNKVILSERFEC